MRPQVGVHDLKVHLLEPLVDDLLARVKSVLCRSSTVSVALKRVMITLSSIKEKRLIIP